MLTPSVQVSSDAVEYRLSFVCVQSLSITIQLFSPLLVHRSCMMRVANALRTLTLYLLFFPCPSYTEVPLINWWKGVRLKSFPVQMYELVFLRVDAEP